VNGLSHAARLNPAQRFQHSGASTRRPWAKLQGTAHGRRTCARASSPASPCGSRCRCGYLRPT
jgi:hypothetical protein